MDHVQHKDNSLSYVWIAKIIQEENLRAGFAGGVAYAAAALAAQRIETELRRRVAAIGPSWHHARRSWDDDRRDDG